MPLFVNITQILIFFFFTLFFSADAVCLLTTHQEDVEMLG